MHMGRPMVVVCLFSKYEQDQYPFFSPWSNFDHTISHFHTVNLSTIETLNEYKKNQVSLLSTTSINISITLELNCVNCSAISETYPKFSTRDFPDIWNKSICNQIIHNLHIPNISVFCNQNFEDKCFLNFSLKLFWLITINQLIN